MDYYLLLLIIISFSDKKTIVIHNLYLSISGLSICYNYNLEWPKYEIRTLNFQQTINISIIIINHKSTLSWNDKNQRLSIIGIYELWIQIFIRINLRYNQKI